MWGIGDPLVINALLSLAPTLSIVLGLDSFEALCAAFISYSEPVKGKRKEHWCNGDFCLLKKLCSVSEVEYINFCP